MFILPDMQYSIYQYLLQLIAGSLPAILVDFA